VILVITGTNGGPFDRLLRELDHLGANEEVVVQHGPSNLRPIGARCVEYVPFEDLRQLIGDARVVVTHGGVGSVLTTLSNGHKPIVIPRRLAHGEAVDDHQVTFARRLHKEGLVTLVDDPRELRNLVHASTTRGCSEELGAGRLRNELAAYLHAVPRVAV
jgi:exopolysaccharide biosynthesis glucuronosyltransferase PssE